MKLKFFLLFIFPALIYSQDNLLTADFDGDSIADKVYYDSQNGNVVYELSSQKFKKVKFDHFEDNGELIFEKSKNGFKVKMNQMRAGNSYQFRYDSAAKKMRLIGMSRYEFGPANNDGSGESSVNLLTNDYIAEWHYFHEESRELIKIPTIKKKMIFARTYFDTMTDEFSTYMRKDSDNYLAAKKRL